MWFEAYEVMDLLEEILCEMEQQHPPALDEQFSAIAFYLGSSVERVKNKSLSSITVLVHFHPAYKEVLY